MTEVKEVKAKKRVNGKAKGNSFELKISKLLSEKLKPLCFKRSQQSGAILGGINAKKMEDYSIEMRALFVGDICPTNEGNENPKFKFVVECKFYKEAERMESLFGTSLIYKWIKEAQIDSLKINKQAALIFRFNNTSNYLAVDSNVKLPDEINRLVILDGIQVCILEDILEYRDFWLE